MELLVQNLIRAYDQSITELDWMSPATKIQARKSFHMSIKIGYPKSGVIILTCTSLKMI